MARRKSISDIWNQYERIRRGGNSSRTNRAYNIATSYGRNIQRSSSWRRAFNAAGLDYDKYHGSESYLRSYEPSRRTSQYGAADRVRVSRRTYMGLGLSAG